MLPLSAASDPLGIGGRNQEDIEFNWSEAQGLNKTEGTIFLRFLLVISAFSLGCFCVFFRFAIYAGLALFYSLISTVLICLIYNEMEI